MQTITKIWLIIAALLILLGCILFAGVMTTLEWDFRKLETVNYETNTYEISDTFDSISINTDTADIIFALSNDGKCRVECHEEENVKHSVTVENSTLTIKSIDERTVYNFIGRIGLNFSSPKIKVYLPETEYTALSVKESTGDVEISEGFTFKDVNISLSTGDIKIQKTHTGSLNLTTSTGNITVSEITCDGDIKNKISTGKTNITDTQCKNFISSGSTGDLYLKNVIAQNNFSLKRSTGDVKFDGSDAAEIFVETDTGDVIGSLLTQKVFITETDTGNIDVPKTTTGGKCEIKTDTGNININISN